MTTLEAPSPETTVGNHFIANYPPFSAWTAQAIPAFLETLQRPARPGPLGMYLHIPFCRQRCHYCYFRVYPRRTAEDVRAYIDALLREQQLHLQQPALHGRRPNSVYFGGGSPTYLEADEIKRLMSGLQEVQPWDAVDECTVECEPASVTPEKFRVLRECGATRLSLGFQSLDAEILRRSGRDVSPEACLRGFAEARAAGFEEINVDLIAGLPGETGTTWLSTVERVLALEPDCLTVYQLELTYNSGLYGSQRAGGNVDLPSWPQKRRWAEEAFAMAEAAGYTVVSGYMAVRHPRRWRFEYTVEHFWKGTDLLALGESSFGHLQSTHYQNVDTFEAYLAKVARGELPLRRALRVTPDQRLRREVILLLKTGSLDFAYFEAKHHVDLREYFHDEFAELASLGWLEILADSVRLTRPGLLRVDTLLRRFYHPEYLGVRYT